MNYEINRYATKYSDIRLTKW